ncbi:MAG TPA: MarR family winged helix-turn-helix transcriptional regulator [Fimbriimonadaceae bacterium]|nr:MarR family winged helix-turn-helix transcriptional regulator [Fimbriimonadaceae bacterium]
MNPDEQAHAFIEAFQGVYLRFHVRRPAHAYRPSPESLAVLRHLAQTGPILVSEACAHFSRSQAAMSDIFKRLEKRGLVERMEDSRDRRKTLTWLTETGQAILKESEQALSPERIGEALTRLPESERQGLIEGLRRLAEAGG